MTALLTDNLPLLAGSPNGIKKLRELILELAVRGKLVQQISDDKKASYWVDLIELEKARLVDAGLLKKSKKALGAVLEEVDAKIPGSWCWVTLADITLGMDSGWSPACEPNPSPSNGVWGVLKTTAVQVMHYLQEENKELPAHLEPRPDAEVKTGDILFTRAGPINRVGISCLVENTRPRLMISDKIIRFHPVGVGVYGRYIALCLNSGTTASYLENAKSGMAASQVNISQEKLKLAPIPLAPLPEQHRIVAKVDELMALCDRLEAQQTDAESAHTQLVQALLDSLTQASDATDFAANWQRLTEHFQTLFTTESSIDALKQTLLQLAVMGKLVPQDPSDEPAVSFLERHGIKSQPYILNGWTEVPLGHLGEILSGSTPSKSNAAFWDGDIPWVSPKDMKRPVIHDAQDYISAKALAQTSLKIVPPNSVLMVVRGMILAHSFPVALTAREITINQDMKALVPPMEISTYLLMCLQAAKGVMVQLVDRSSHGTCKLISEKLWAFTICLPPVAEQHRIAAKVDQLMTICHQLKTRLSQARQLNEKLASTLAEQAVA